MRVGVQIYTTKILTSRILLCLIRYYHKKVTKKLKGKGNNTYIL